MKDDEFNPFMKFHGINIPNGIAMTHSSHIPDATKLLLGRLMQYSGRDGKAYPSRKALCKDLGGVSLSVINRSIRTLKDLKLIRTIPLDKNNKQSPNLYTFLKNDLYEKPLVKSDSTPNIKSDSTPNIKSDKYNRIINNRINTNRFINKSNDSGEPINSKNNLDNKDVDPKKIKKIRKLKKRNIFAAKLKKRKIQQNETKKTQLKSKYKNTILGLKSYIELTNLKIGITNHGEGTKAKINSIDKLHALFSPKCKNPYNAMEYIPDQYITYKWDLDEIIEVFKYQIQHAEQYNKSKIKSIGAFIFTEGFNKFKSWSPLLHWHQKMTKTAANELTEKGKKFLLSLKRAKVNGAMDLDSTIINKVADETYYVANKHVFMDGKTITMSYPCGIIDTLSKYIKEKTNNDGFKLVYITKNGFVNEFLDTAMKRNIIKPKSNGRRAFSNA